MEPALEGPAWARDTDDPSNEERQHTTINRKTFLKSLAGLVAWALPLKATARPVAADSANVMPSVLVPEPTPWLKQWLAAKRIPILDSQHPVERFFIRAWRRNEPVTFICRGGSHPGTVREVHPVMLYRVEGYLGAYFTGYCRARQAIRTFCLDRVTLMPVGETHDS